MNKINNSLVTFLLSCAVGVIVYVTAQAYIPGPSNVQINGKLKPFGDLKTTVPQIHHPIVRIHMTRPNGACSATVIDNNYALTAAHCLYTPRLYLSKGEISVFSDTGEDTNIKAKAAAINIEDDYALITGDFSTFQKLPVNLTDFSLFNQKVVISCGYPMDQKSLVCTNIHNVVPYGFKYAGYGQLVKGMSGGPVISVQLLMGIVPFASVVGVNSAVSGDVPVNAIVAPIVGLLGAFNLEVKMER